MEKPLAGLLKGNRGRGGTSCRILARRLAGGEGKVGEGQEEVGPHL